MGTRFTREQWRKIPAEKWVDFCDSFDFAAFPSANEVKEIVRGTCRNSLGELLNEIWLREIYAIKKCVEINFTLALDDLCFGMHPEDEGFVAFCNTQKLDGLLQRYVLNLFDDTGTFLKESPLLDELNILGLTS
jgi:hypothetical protein